MEKFTLRALRINANLSREDVASRLEVSVSTIANWEKGASFPTPPMIEKICELYHTSYDAINFLPAN